MKDKKEIINEIRNLIKNTLNIILKHDKNNLIKELDYFNSMSDKDLVGYLKKEKFFVVIEPFKEPNIDDVKELGKFLKIELDEKLILPRLGNIVTENPVSVGYAPIKFLEQIAMKKISQSHNISETNIVTGNMTNQSKTRSLTAPETANMFAYGVQGTVLKEFMQSRADNRDAKYDMLKQISENGVFYLKDSSSTGVTQTAKTLNYFLIGSCIDSDIIPDTVVSVDKQKVDIRKSE